MMIFSVYQDQKRLVGIYLKLNAAIRAAEIEQTLLIESNTRNQEHWDHNYSVIGCNSSGGETFLFWLNGVAMDRPFRGTTMELRRFEYIVPVVVSDLLRYYGLRERRILLRQPLRDIASLVERVANYTTSTSTHSN